MSVWAEVLRDGPIRSEETLGVAGALKPLHAPLPLTYRLVRVLRAIIEIPVLAMFHLRQAFSLGDTVTLQFIGDEHPRDGGQPFEQLAEELLCGPLIPETLDQDIEHIPLLIHRPPQMMALAVIVKYTSSICHLSPGRN